MRRTQDLHEVVRRHRSGELEVCIAGTFLKRRHEAVLDKNTVGVKLDDQFSVIVEKLYEMYIECGS